MKILRAETGGWQLGSLGPGIVLLWVMLMAVAAAGQTVEDLPDSAATSAMVEELPGELPEELPEPNAAAIEVPEVNMWDSGVSATGAVVATPVFPGWGQLYSDNFWKAGLGFGVQMYFWTNIVNRDRQAVRARDFAYTFPVDDPNYALYNSISAESWEQMRDFAWWSGGILLIIALDAYVDAHLFNFNDDPVPVPDRWDETFGPVGESVGFSDPGPTLTVFQWRKKF